MKEQEILEGNKLIAEFMGFSQDYIDMRDSFTTGGLKYHSSWDWLMPVVVKCLDINKEELDEWESHYENIDDSFFHVEISQTFDAVVQFIKLKSYERIQWTQELERMER